MPENQSDPRKNFAPRILPWILAAAMFVVYLVTLNHWVSFISLGPTTEISGSWLPQFSSPLLFLITYPFRWLPAAATPIALNIFSAVCAALTLALLARSVAILPQDRTEAQRRREGNAFSFLTIRSAWLPPALAVVVCGLQMTFWQHATNYTGEMFDLLLFAFIVWSLLEYRLDEREGRLFLAALVYGASMAENWAMVGFFPLFIAALIWIRGFSFFEWRFLRTMFLCGLIGTMFYFLMPVVAAFSSNFPVTFWQALKFNLAPQFQLWKSIFYFIFHPGQSSEYLSIFLAYLLPLFVLALRWRRGFGDQSAIGAALTSFMFHVVHAVFLGLLIWMAFDPAFSPRHLGTVPLLTFYFLGALSVGYYCGYFLLIFGKKEKLPRGMRRKPSPLQFLNPCVVTAVWIFAAAATVGLIYRNAPEIKTANDKMLSDYTSLLENSLPANGGYILSDDPRRLALVQLALARDGRAKKFIPLNTQSLVLPAYHRYLHKKYPARWPDLVSPGQTNTLNPVGLVQIFAILSKTNDIYYLHPSFGYYFEQFYAEPHGLAYQLKPLPNDTMLPPTADKNLIAENETFWTNTAASALASVENNLTPSDSDTPLTFGERILKKLHIERGQSRAAAAMGSYYSQSLNFWGVQLQRAKKLPQAADCFELATDLNPDNVVVAVNLDFNQKLRAGKPTPVDLEKTEDDQFSNWNRILNTDGPFDEPSFCFKDGIILARGNHFFRQAVAQFHRTRELAPDFLPARYQLAQIYLMAHQPDRALDELKEPLANPEKFSLAETNKTQLRVLAAAADFQKNEIAKGAKLLETEVALHPDNNELVTSTARAFIMHGLADKALAIIDRELKSAPGDLQWLYNRGYVNIQLKHYDAAVADLSRVLAVQTNNYNALFNRAVANLQANHLDAARADYQKLQQTFTNSAPVAYGLGEIAFRRGDTNAAIRNYEIYLANAKTNTAEAEKVTERLNSLKR